MSLDIERLESLKTEAVVVKKAEIAKSEKNLYDYQPTEDDKNMGLQIEKKEKSSLGYDLNKSSQDFFETKLNQIKDILQGKGFLKAKEEAAKSNYKNCEEFIEKHPTLSFFTGHRFQKHLARILIGEEEVNKLAQENASDSNIVEENETAHE